MPTQVSDAINIRDTAQSQLALSTTAAQTAAIETPGIYDLWCDVNCYVKINSTANDVTTSTGYLLLANNVVPFTIGKGDKIGAIVAAGTGTLSYQKVG